MLKKCFCVLLLLAGGAAHAQSASSANTTVAGAGAEAVAYGGGTTSYKDSSIATVPALATLLDSPTASCQATYSGTAAAVGFGIGLSGSKTDKNCEDLEQIRAVYNMQQQSTAVLMMCEFANFRKARALQGQPCPPQYGDSGQVAVTPVAAAASSPPIPAPAGYAASAAATQPTIYRPAFCNQQIPVDEADKATYAYYCK
ncbi:MAG TPA: hypothetical protein VMT20_15085 [Terriglobia bacterium]|nr:hypothetical protein [Terriglobia bacterium]